MNFWTHQRLNRLSFVVLLGIGIAISVSALTDTSQTGLLLRGDFPAFYAAGTLHAQGKTTELYHQVAQQQIENAAWPSLAGTFYAFTYPPFVAVIFSPFASLSPVTAKLLYTSSMIALLWLAVYLWSFLDEAVRKHRFFSFVYLFALAPVFIGVLGGQNNALSLLLFSLVTGLLVRTNIGPHFFAGVATGLWLFKPQLSLLFALYCLFWGRIPFAVGYFISALSLFALGAYAVGANWLVVWLNAIREFAKEDFSVNAHQLISLTDGLYAAVQQSNNWTVGSIIQLLFLLIAATLAAIALWKLSRSKTHKPLTRISAAGVLLVVLSPHMLFYEFGLAVLPSLGGFIRRGDRGIWQLLALNVVVSLSTALRGYGLLMTLPVIATALAAFLVFDLEQIDQRHQEKLI